MTLLRNLILTLVVLLWIPAMQTQSVPAPSNVKTVQLTFTTIDVPGADITGVFGINSVGDMVGYYGPDNGSGLDKHGFLYRDGGFTLIDYPGADSTFAQGINDSGLIAGSAEFQGGVTRTGFLYDGTTFNPIHTRQPLTFFWSMNNAGDVVGSAGVSGGNFRGFVLRNGRFRVVNFPGEYTIANPTGINDLGHIAGYTVAGNDTHSYLYRNGRFKDLNFPGAQITQAQAVNNNGVVVGWYFIYPNAYGFAYKNGKYISFGYPGAVGTAAMAINSSGEIAGQYKLTDQTYHGFVTSAITDADFVEAQK